MSRVNDRLRQTLEIGEWWHTPWWRDDKYYKDEVVSRDSAEIAFYELKKTFNAEWLLSQKMNGSLPFRHPIAIQLTTEGLQPFQTLYDLGFNLHIARAANLLGDIDRRLKNPHEYWEAAIFELKLLSRFLQSGYEIRRHYLSGKGRCNCDFKISKGSQFFFVEIKRPKELSEINLSIIDNTTTCFLAELSTGDITENDPSSAPFSSRSEIEKVFRLLRYAASKQIPEGGPGIIIVESPHVLNWQTFAEIAERRFQKSKKYLSISAVILMQAVFHGGKICHTHDIVFNPRANIDIRSADVLNVLREL